MWDNHGVYVSGFSRDVCARDIAEVLERAFGRVDRVDIPVPIQPSGKPKFAFVTFADHLNESVATEKGCLEVNGCTWTLDLNVSKLWITPTVSPTLCAEIAKIGTAATTETSG